MTSIDPILEGRAISTCLQQTGVLPPLARTMLDAAEETGFYEDFFRRLSKMYQEEVKYTRQQLQDMIDHPCDCAMFRSGS